MSEHAIENAKGWMETIREYYEAYCALGNDDSRPVVIEGTVVNTVDELLEHVQEQPLSVEVRGDWRTPGSKAEDVEFLVLLTTGGPALRITGELDQNNCPRYPVLQWQDWGTPWTPYDTTTEDDEALQWFCEQFYYGEG